MDQVEQSPHIPGDNGSGRDVLECFLCPLVGITTRDYQHSWHGPEPGQRDDHGGERQDVKFKALHGDGQCAPLTQLHNLLVQNMI